MDSWFSAEYFDQLRRCDLSDSAWLLHMQTLMSMYRNEGIPSALSKRYLEKAVYTGTGEFIDAVEELLAKDLWRELNSSEVVVEHGRSMVADVLRRQLGKRARDAGAQRSRRAPAVRALMEDIKAGRERCRECGATENLQVDHVRPRSKGGSDDPANLQVLCRSCNSSKNDRDYTEWRMGRRAHTDTHTDT